MTTSSSVFLNLQTVLSLPHVSSCEHEDACFYVGAVMYYQPVQCLTKTSLKVSLSLFYFFFTEFKDERQNRKARSPTMFCKATTKIDLVGKVLRDLQQWLQRVLFDQQDLISSSLRKGNIPQGGTELLCPLEVYIHRPPPKDMAPAVDSTEFD